MVGMVWCGMLQWEIAEARKLLIDQKYTAAKEVASSAPFRFGVDQFCMTLQYQREGRFGIYLVVVDNDLEGPTNGVTYQFEICPVDPSKKWLSSPIMSFDCLVESHSKGWGSLFNTSQAYISVEGKMITRVTINAATVDEGSPTRAAHEAQRVLTAAYYDKTFTDVNLRSNEGDVFSAHKVPALCASVYVAVHLINRLFFVCVFLRADSSGVAFVGV
jgi:hypothetical protein